jgi:hypothetical protein
VKALEKTLDLDRLERTEVVAVSGLVPLRESLSLFAAQSEPGHTPDRPGARWPDFARYDCYACHHDVSRPGWRVQRGFADAPGRPPAPLWPTALVEAAVEAVDPKRADERLAVFDRRLREFHRALGAQPFGQRERAIASARDLVVWADEILSDLGRVRIGRAGALRMLERICARARVDLPEHDTARQLYWAFLTIYREIEPKAGPDDPVLKTLRELDAQLGFSLPGAGVQEPIEKTLAKRLKATADFDPAPFQERFATLAAQLPKS